MKTIFKRITDAPYAILAAATVTALGTDSANAAGEDLGGIAKGLVDQMGSVGKLMVAGAMVGGIVMLASGLMKLKQAADTQGNQVKYSEGLWRCGVGAALIALPAFANVLTKTGDMGDVNITPASGF
jgi:predicted histidine transporter YuiF (NhaC family)